MSNSHLDTAFDVYTKSLHRLTKTLVNTREITIGHSCGGVYQRSRAGLKIHSRFLVVNGVAHRRRDPSLMSTTLSMIVRDCKIDGSVCVLVPWLCTSCWWAYVAGYVCVFVSECMSECVYLERC